MIQAQPLSVSSFAPFGDVVSAGLRAAVSANMGTALRFNRCAELRSTRPQATPNLAVFRSTPPPLPLQICLLERHPCSSQAFLPLLCSRYLVVVAPELPEGGPDESAIQAFVCGPGQGINYHLGVWHHPMIALDREADFAMLAWEDDGPLDCEVRTLSVPQHVHL